VQYIEMPTILQNSIKAEDVAYLAAADHNNDIKSNQLYLQNMNS